MTLFQASSSLATNGLAAYTWGTPGLGGMAPWQRAFHADPARLRAIIAGNQTGKSRAGAAEAWWCATGTHPWRHVPRNEGLGWICVATWGRPYQQVVRNLMATCPRQLVDWNRTTYVEDDDRFVNHQIVLLDGFTIRFVPTGGGSTNAAAGTVDWLWIDEPPAASKWGELLKRPSRHQGPIWETCTPWDSTQDLTWLKLELEGEPEKGIAPRAPWSITRAPYLPAYVPWMRPADVYTERSLVPAAESPIRNDGCWEGAVQGRYFTAYQPPYNALPATPSDTNTPWQICVGADHGEGAGSTAVPISAQRRRANNIPEIHFISEYVSTDRSSIVDDARGIRQALRAVNLDLADVSRWWGDTNTLGKASPGARVNAALATQFRQLLLDEAATTRRSPAELTPIVPVIRIDDADKRPGAPDTGWRLMALALGLGCIHVDAARCPQLDRALNRWQGKDDGYKHILDGARYQTYELLTDTLGRQLGTRSSRLY